MDTNPPTPNRDPNEPLPGEGSARAYSDNSGLPPTGSAPLRGPHAEIDYTPPTSEPTYTPSVEPYPEQPLPAPEGHISANIPPGAAPTFGLGPETGSTDYTSTTPPPPVTYELPPASQAGLPPAAPPPPNNRNRNCLLIALGIGGLLLCAVCALVALPLIGLSAFAPQINEALSTIAVITPEAFDEGDTGTDSPGTDLNDVDGQMISVYDLSVGDCFDDTAEDLINEVEVVPCEGPHDNEVFAIFDHPAGADEAFPGEELETYTDEECTSAFEEFVGTPYDQSALYYFPIRPTEETWDQGDREIVCALYGVDDNTDPIKIEGSMQGSNR
jgi:hypothetical protein